MQNEGNTSIEGLPVERNTNLNLIKPWFRVISGPGGVNVSRIKITPLIGCCQGV
jgi:hypothetical protein